MTKRVEKANKAVQREAASRSFPFVDLLDPVSSLTATDCTSPLLLVVHNYLVLTPHVISLIPSTASIRPYSPA